MRPMVSLLLASLLGLVVSGCRDSPTAQMAPSAAAPGASGSPVTVVQPATRTRVAVLETTG